MIVVTLTPLSCDSEKEQVMSVGNICHRNVITMEKDKSLVEAAKLMRKHHVGDVIVVEKHDGRTIPVGIITDRDMVVEAVAPELDPELFTAEDIMVGNMVVVREEDDVFEAIQIMTKKGIRRLPVVDKDGELSGIVTLDDLFVMMVREFGNFAKLLNHEQKNESRKRH
jgi:CBS domain-containing protein